ncbi:MAG: hypothetical protein MJ180_03450 [Candidatus Gastranaerophilales bacterium]|nr:hypothetical protein [Candidatus Gastranaerophilales bacterium]
MSFTARLENVLTKLGKNNSPTIVAMGIATAKGICRPIFTMMDEHEKPEKKRYTAIREGLTEVIAIPVYYASGVVTKFIADKLANKKFFMDKNTLSAIKKGNITPQIQQAITQAEKLTKENLPKIRTSLNFVGVCVSALFLIPFICSVAIKPIMKKVNSRNTSVSDNKVQTINNKYTNLYNPKTQIIGNKAFNTFRSTSSGMKVGGL